MMCLTDLASSGYESASRTPGFSSVAKAIDTHLADLRRSRGESISLSGRYHEAASELDSIMRECATSGWDGEGSHAVSISSAIQARRFLDALPSGFEFPEVSVDPDGEIAFEWRAAPGRAFSISFGAGGKLTYAGTYGPNTTYGTEYFAHGLPGEIMDKVRRVYYPRG